jgi:hypothetical protein
MPILQKRTYQLKDVVGKRTMTAKCTVKETKTGVFHQWEFEITNPEYNGALMLKEFQVIAQVMEWLTGLGFLSYQSEWIILKDFIKSVPRNFKHFD